MPISIDPQASGWEDSLSRPESGLINTRPLRGDLTILPFKTARFGVDGSGAVSQALQFQNAVENPSGFPGGWLITVPASASPGYNGGMGSRFWGFFYGTCFGLSFQRGYNQPSNFPFDLEIDGIAYPVTNGDFFPDTASLAQAAANAQWSNSHALDLIASDLPDSKHFFRFSFPCQLATQSQWLLWGIIVDKRAGYRDPAFLWHDLVFVGTLTNAFVAPTIKSGAANAATITGLSSIIYTNTDAAPHVVTIQQNNVTIWQTLLAAAGTAGCTDTFIPARGAPCTFDTSHFTHKTDANAAVNYTLTGVY